MKIALLIKKDKPYQNRVKSYLQNRFHNVSVFSGALGDSYPAPLLENSFDIIFSWLSPWIVPKKTLDLTKYYNINFHPGPPEYPGIGCFNFALYNQEQKYGVTCHIMEPKVDKGDIIGVRKFQISNDSVLSLSLKSYDAMFALFKEVVDYIIQYNKTPETNETWQRSPYQRQDLEALCMLDLTMDKKEIEKRIRATTYPDMPGAYFIIHNKKFEYNSDR